MSLSLNRLLCLSLLYSPHFSPFSTLSSFQGRLGGLGTIDEKYDVAASTAAPALDNMVVDDADTGTKCVEYLR